MTKIVSVSLVFCILTIQLWWRPDSARTDEQVAKPAVQVDDTSGRKDCPCESENQLFEDGTSCDSIDDESDSETGSPEDQPVHPILVRAVVAEKSGRLTRSFCMSKVLALSNSGQVVNGLRDSRGDLSDCIAAATRCRTSSLLAIARATRPHAPPYV